MAIAGGYLVGAIPLAILGFEPVAGLLAILAFFAGCQVFGRPTLRLVPLSDVDS